jgi:cbb3-type cytochrome oxidase maturation protein
VAARNAGIIVIEYLTAGEFVVATLMGLAALCAFVWGATSGALSDTEASRHQVLRAEDIDDDGR